MNRKIEILRELGCDVDGALDRCLMDEEFYLSLLQQAVTDEAFGRLGFALQEKNVQEAFNHAHTLKGILANMGLTPLYELTVKIVEPLRQGQDIDLGDEYQALIQERDKFLQMIGPA